MVEDYFSIKKLLASILESEADDSISSSKMLDITQLYLSRLFKHDDIDNTQKSLSDKEERYTLERLLEIDRDLVVAKRIGYTAQIHNDKSILNEIKSELESKSIPNMYPHRRYIDGVVARIGVDKHLRTFYEDAKKVLNRTKIDTIVYIAQGGLEPALLVKKIKPNAEIVPVRYSTYYNLDSAPILLNYMDVNELSKKITGKSVILVDDDIDSGGSMTDMVEWTAGMNPKNLYFGSPVSSDLKSHINSRLRRIANNSKELVSDKEMDTEGLRQWPVLYKVKNLEKMYK